jgi:conjugal transfer pilus assembly protein TraK
MRMLTVITMMALAVGNAHAEDATTEVRVSSLSAAKKATQPKASAPGNKKDSFYGTTATEPAPTKKGKGQTAEGKSKSGSQTDGGKEDSDGDKKEPPLPQATSEGIGEQSVLPEVQMKAKFSASDVNRVVCSSDIKDVTFSKEKGVMVKYSGKNAFVKFAVTKVGEKTLYAVNPVELFVICGESVYNIIAIPKHIPSQTIRLNSGRLEKIQKNHEVHSGQAFEKKIDEIIKSTYTDELPESYTVVNKSQEIKAFRDATVFLKREITVDGEGLVMLEYYVSPHDNVEQLVISERDFMKKDFGSRPVAISADKLTIRKGEVGRVFVLDAKEANNVERP